MIQRIIRITKSGIWLTAGQAVSSLMSFVQALAFGNLLPQQTYGIYKYVLSVAGILSQTSLPGINTALTGAIAKGKANLIKKSFWTKVKFGLLGSIGAVALAVYYLLKNNATLAIAFGIVAIAVPLIDSFWTISTVLQGKEKFKELSLYGAFTNIVATIAITAVLFFTQNPVFLLTVYFGIWISLRGLIYILIFPTETQIAQDADGTIKYGIQLSFLSALGVLATQIDKVLLFTLVGGVELAIYTFATAIPEQIKGILKNVAVISLPKFARRDDENPNNIMLWGLVFMLLIFAITVVYIFAAPFIYKLLFPKYIGSIFYSQIFALSMFTTASLIPTTYMRAKKQVKNLYLVETVTNILQIVLLVIGVTIAGIMGALVSRIISRVVWTILAFSVIYLKPNKQTDSV